MVGGWLGLSVAVDGVLRRDRGREEEGFWLAGDGGLTSMTGPSSGGCVLREFRTDSSVESSAREPLLWRLALEGRVLRPLGSWLCLSSTLAELCESR
jgi:hypothetical protein